MGRQRAQLPAKRWHIYNPTLTFGLSLNFHSGIVYMSVQVRGDSERLDIIKYLISSLELSHPDITAYMLMYYTLSPNLLTAQGIKKRR